MRPAYIILSARSLPYARLCIETLALNSIDPLRLRLVTDGPDDVIAIQKALADLKLPSQHAITVHGQAEVDAIANTKLADFELVRHFRLGHPCWRKITDAALFAEDGEEMIILDPDLYFPTRFAFEPTPHQGVLLMWQKPNCLLPPETVRAVMNASIPLADHVDIGVGQLRAPLDWAWLERLVATLGGRNIPRLMHVEAIVWAAMAMHIGGSHLNPRAFRCWHRTQWKRLRLKLGTAGVDILRDESMDGVKCFHAGGPAKQWVPEWHASGGPGPLGAELGAPTPTLAYVELSRRKYETEQAAKGLLRRSGYYRVFGSS